MIRVVRLPEVIYSLLALAATSGDVTLEDARWLASGQQSYFKDYVRFAEVLGLVYETDPCHEVELLGSKIESFRFRTCRLPTLQGRALVAGDHKTRLQRIVMAIPQYRYRCRAIQDALQDLDGALIQDSDIEQNLSLKHVPNELLSGFTEKDEDSNFRKFIDWDVQMQFRHSKSYPYYCRQRIAEVLRATGEFVEFDVAYIFPAVKGKYGVEQIVALVLLMLLTVAARNGQRLSSASTSKFLQSVVDQDKKPMSNLPKLEEKARFLRAHGIDIRSVSGELELCQRVIVKSYSSRLAQICSFLNQSFDANTFSWEKLSRDLYAELYPLGLFTGETSSLEGQWEMADDKLPYWLNHRIEGGLRSVADVSEAVRKTDYFTVERKGIPLVNIFSGALLDRSVNELLELALDLEPADILRIDWEPTETRLHKRIVLKSLTESEVVAGRIPIYEEEPSTTRRTALAEWLRRGSGKDSDLERMTVFLCLTNPYLRVLSEVIRYELTAVRRKGVGYVVTWPSNERPLLAALDSVMQSLGYCPWNDHYRADPGVSSAIESAMVRTVSDLGIAEFDDNDSLVRTSWFDDLSKRESQLFYANKDLRRSMIDRLGN